MKADLTAPVLPVPPPECAAARTGSAYLYKDRAEPQSIILFAGSGGCDSGDSACSNGNASTTVITSLEITDSGVKVVDATDFVFSPKWLLQHPEKGVLYSTDSSKELDVDAMSISSDNKLTVLNSVPSAGGDPVHTVLDFLNKYIFVASYTGSTLSVLPVNTDGSLARWLASCSTMGAA